MSDLASEIKEFMDSVRDPTKSAVRTSTQSPSHRKHDHYTMGRMGYNPKLARLQNHDKPKNQRGTTKLAVELAKDMEAKFP